MIESKSIIRSGTSVHEEGGESRGRIGLLAVDQHECLFALTVTTVISAGRNGIVDIDGHPARLDAFHWTLELGGDEGGDCGTLVGLEVPRGYPVIANAAGVGQAVQPVEVVEALDCPLQVFFGSGPSKGRVTSFGESALIRGLRGKRSLHELFEVELDECGAGPSPGDAGSLITTEGSRPLGFVVGARHGRLLATPVAAFFRRYGLTSLDTHRAAFHSLKQPKYELMRRDRSAHEHISTSRRMAPTITSTQLLNQSPLPELVRELEASMV